MLRIVTVADVSSLRVTGGGGRVLWEQAVRLAGRGHRVTVVSRAEDTAVSVDRQGVSVREFAVDRRSASRFILSSVRGARRGVVRALEESGADVLHLHQPLSGWSVLGSAAGRLVPSLYTFHSPAPLEYRMRRGMTRLHRGGLAGRLGTVALWWLERACVRRARRVHVLSAFSADLVRRLYQVAPERIVRIPGGVDATRFAPAADRAAVRRALGLPAARPLAFTLRNLEARMGLDSLLRAVARLRAAVPDVLLLVGGDGSLRAELEALAASLGLGGHVRFLGFVADAELPRWYQAADVFVLPTRALEGFGLVTLEALACGTPVLGTPVGATPEILRALAPPLLFRDESAEAIAEGLAAFFARLAADPEGDRRLRLACRRLAETSYSWDASVDRLEATLAEIAG